MGREIGEENSRLLFNADTHTHIQTHTTHTSFANKLPPMILGIELNASCIIIDLLMS